MDGVLHFRALMKHIRGTSCSQLGVDQESKQQHGQIFQQTVQPEHRAVPCCKSALFENMTKLWTKILSKLFACQNFKQGHVVMASDLPCKLPPASSLCRAFESIK